MLFRSLGVLPLFFLAASASTTELFGTTIVESCLTYLGPQQVCQVPTNTNTRTETVFEPPVFAASTSTPLVTTTLLPSTQTISSTKTITSTIIDSTITNTFTSTSTIFSTIIDTTVVSLTLTTSTETFSSATTIIVATSTISTLTGFLPVSDTTATAYPDVLIKKREFSHIRDFSILKNINYKPYDGSNGGLNGAQIQSVECIVSSEIRATFVQVIYLGETQTKTVTPTTTTTITILETSTSTLAPSVSSTISISTTLISTSTLTQTTTLFTASTSLEVLTVSDTTTSYAACATNNLLASVNSSSPNIDNIYNNGNADPVYTIGSADSAVDCCVACQVAVDCESFAYYVYDETIICYLFNRPSGSCSATNSTASQSGGAGFYTYEDGSEILFVVGNGACGYLYDGGIGGP